MGAAGEHVGVTELGHLLARGLDQLLDAIAQRRAPQARHALDVLLARDIGDVHALGGVHDQRALGAMRDKVRRRMHQRIKVAFTKQVSRSHGVTPWPARQAPSPPISMYLIST